MFDLRRRILNQRLTRVSRCLNSDLGYFLGVSNTTTTVLLDLFSLFDAFFFQNRAKDSAGIGY